MSDLTSCPLSPSGLFCENPPPMILLQTSPCDQSECQNGGHCLVVAGEPICRCIPGYYGNKCDKISTVHFLGRDGFVELHGTKLRPTAHISLQVGLTFDLCVQQNGFPMGWLEMSPQHDAAATRLDRLLIWSEVMSFLSVYWLIGRIDPVTSIID